LTGEDGQTVARGVLSEVDEKIDFVVSNPGGERIVVEAKDVEPNVCVLAEIGRDFIRLRDGGVTKYFEPPVVVMVQQRAQISADHMVSEIGGNVTYAQASDGVTAIGVRSAKLTEGFADVEVPTALFLEDCGGRQVRRIMEE
jgi:hypothetical protein